MNSRRTKIIHIITMLEMGGAQGNTLFTVAHLDRSRFETGLICGPGGMLDLDAAQIPGVQLTFVPPLIRPVHPGKDLLALIALTKILKKEKPDIVHTHSSKAGILGRLAAKLAGVPIIIHSIHGFGFNPCQKFPVRQSFVLLERFMAAFTDTLVAVSEANIKEGLRLGIGKRGTYTLIRSGVDIQGIRDSLPTTGTRDLRQALGISSGARIVLSAGPFKIQKDPVAFVKCAAKVAAEVPDVVFLWSGDGELRSEVEEEIRRSGLGNAVRLLGWRTDIPALLKLCDVFILTSLWEGLPRAAVEALVAGKPVVAFGVDGVPEVVKDGANGFVLPPGDHEGLAKKLIRLLQEPDLYQSLSEEAARTIGESFDIHLMVRQQEAVYERLLNSRDAPRVR